MKTIELQYNNNNRNNESAAYKYSSNEQGNIILVFKFE